MPAFVISELKTAFMMGFLISLPFLLVDLVVSSVLTSMGMVMMPPVMISAPFKLLLFVLADGWQLVAQALSELRKQGSEEHDRCSGGGIERNLLYTALLLALPHGCEPFGWVVDQCLSNRDEHSRTDAHFRAAHSGGGARPATPTALVSPGGHPLHCANAVAHGGGGAVIELWVMSFSLILAGSALL